MPQSKANNTDWHDTTDQRLVPAAPVAATYPARWPPGSRLVQRWVLSNAAGSFYTFAPTVRGVLIEFSGARPADACRCTLPAEEARALWARLRRKGYIRY